MIWYSAFVLRKQFVVTYSFEVSNICVSNTKKLPVVCKRLLTNIQIKQAHEVSLLV